MAVLLIDVDFDPQYLVAIASMTINSHHDEELIIRAKGRLELFCRQQLLHPRSRFELKEIEKLLQMIQAMLQFILFHPNYISTNDAGHSVTDALVKLKVAIVDALEMLDTRLNQEFLNED